MLRIPDKLESIYKVRATRNQDGTLTVEIPEVVDSNLDIEDGELLQVALFSTENNPTEFGVSNAGRSENGHIPDSSDTPVDEGEKREVEVTEKGDKGDGIAKIDDGFVLIVPDADVGEIHRVEVTRVDNRFAFSESIECIGSVNGNNEIPTR